VLSDTELNLFFQEYVEDYGLIKGELGLKNDFIISVKDADGNVQSEEILKPRNTNIFAKNIGVRILDQEANLKPFIMNIQTW